MEGAKDKKNDAIIWKPDKVLNTASMILPVI